MEMLTLIQYYEPSVCTVFILVIILFTTAKQNNMLKKIQCHMASLFNQRFQSHAFT